MKKMRNIGVALIALTLITTACSKGEVKEDATKAKNEVTNVANDVKKEATDLKDDAEKKATDLKDDAEDKIHELTGKYEGTNGIYNISDVKVIDNKDNTAKIITLELEYTNTTSEKQNPLVAFESDLKIEQNINDKKELLQSALQDVPEDYKTEELKNTSLEVDPNNSSKILLAFNIKNNDEKVILTDVKNNGNDFTREYTVIE